MQLYALDSEGKKCFARDAAKGNDYFCLECSSRVRARSGHAIRAHFYHIASESSCRQAGKTEQHIAIQELIMEQIGSGVLEMRFDAIGRVADVSWPEKRLIFEVQCSPISQEEVEARNHDYATQGFDVVWILYDKTFGYKKRTACQMALKSRVHYYSDAVSLYDWAKRYQKSKIRVDTIVPISFLSDLPDLDDAMSARFYSWGYFAENDFLWRALFMPQKRRRVFSGALVGLFRALWHVVLERSCK